MKPIEEQTILITGTTSGLGQELAQALARQGASLLLHGRDADRGPGLVRKIKEATGNHRIQFYRADLSSLAEVGELARQVISDVARLDVLVNNAGVGFGQDASKRELSQNGYELRFAVNYLAPYLLTERLLPLLKASSPARIVNVASVGKATLRLVVDPALENVTGEYFDGLSLAKAKAQAYDKQVQQRLAALSQRLVSV